MVDRKTNIPTAIPIIYGSVISMVLLRILPDVSGSRKSKMAAMKTEVLTSQLIDKVRFS